MSVIGLPYENPSGGRKNSVCQIREDNFPSSNQKHSLHYQSFRPLLIGARYRKKRTAKNLVREVKKSYFHKENEACPDGKGRNPHGALEITPPRLCSFVHALYRFKFFVSRIFMEYHRKTLCLIP